MSFDWPDYLSLARDLADRADEASHRSAISRAYYAAFHHARRYVESHSPEVLRKNGDDHFLVWNSLLQGVRRQEKSAGVSGKKLCAARKKADYTLVDFSFPKATKDALGDAEAVVKSLAALEQGH